MILLRGIFGTFCGGEKRVNISHSWPAKKGKRKGKEVDKKRRGE
jgi:uncharacterized C2H2 Zn-finger protein